MGLDFYISKKTFIGAMYAFNEVTGSIQIDKHRTSIPIRLERVSYITEDIYHGHKVWWLWGWFNGQLEEELECVTDREVDRVVLRKLYDACCAVKEHRYCDDLREVCNRELDCTLKPDIDSYALDCFFYDVEKLIEALKDLDDSNDVSYIVCASW